MSLMSPSGIMIGLDILMLAYTLWVLSRNGSVSRQSMVFIAIALLSWLAVLHYGLSSRMLFPADVSGLIFLLLIFAAVTAAGVLLLAVPQIRKLLLGLDQQQLLLMQGIRVFFGATFLMQASLGVLPRTFAILDGYTHISAGFFALIAAFSVAANRRDTRWAWFANLFGLLDILIVASSLALVLLPIIGPHHPIMYAVFLPAPLWLWFHLVSIGKLLSRKSRIRDKTNENPKSPVE